jgi:hypothetical protein
MTGRFLLSPRAQRPLLRHHAKGGTTRCRVDTKSFHLYSAERSQRLPGRHPQANGSHERRHPTEVPVPPLEHRLAGPPRTRRRAPGPTVLAAIVVCECIQAASADLRGWMRRRWRARPSR